MYFVRVHEKEFVYFFKLFVITYAASLIKRVQRALLTVTIKLILVSYNTYFFIQHHFILIIENDISFVFTLL